MSLNKKFKSILNGQDFGMTIRNHGFIKGSTWLKCPQWPKGCSFWLKTWGMKDTWFVWLVFFSEVTILTKCEVVHLVKNHNFLKWSIKMPMA